MSADGREQLEAQLSAYLDEELTSDERAEVEAFLAAEPQARELLEELRATVRAVHSLPRATAADDLADAIRSRLERRALLGESPIPGGRTGRAISAATRWVAAAAVVLMTSVAGYVMWSFRDRPETASPRHEELAWNERAPAAGHERAEPLDLLEAKDKKQGAPEADAAASKTPIGDDRSSHFDWLDSIDTGHAQRQQDQSPAPSSVTSAGELGVPVDVAGRSSEAAPIARSLSLSLPAAAPAAPPASPLVAGEEVRSLDEKTLDANQDGALFLTRGSAEVDGRSEFGTTTQDAVAMDWGVTDLRRDEQPAAVALNESLSPAEGEHAATPEVIELVYADPDRQRDAVEVLQSEFNFRVADEPAASYPARATEARERLREIASEEESIAEQPPPDVSYGYRVPIADEESRQLRGRNVPTERWAGARLRTKADALAAATTSPEAAELGKANRPADTESTGDRHGLKTEGGVEYLHARPARGVTVMKIDLPDERTAQDLLARVEQSQAGSAIIRTLDIEAAGAWRWYSPLAKGERYYSNYAGGIEGRGDKPAQPTSRYTYAPEASFFSRRVPARDAGASLTEPKGASREGGGQAGRPESATTTKSLLGLGAGGFGGGGFGRMGSGDQPASAPAAGVPATLPALGDRDRDALYAEGLADHYGIEPDSPHVIRLYLRIEPPATQPAEAASQPASAPEP